MSDRTRELECVIADLKQQVRDAEKERDALRAALRHEADCVEAAKAEIEALRAKIEAMERQEPVMWANSSTNINSSRINRERGGCGDQHTCSETQTTYHDTQLYALPGAQPAPSVPMDVIADYLVSISAHLARRDDAKAQAEIGELLKMIASAPKPGASVPEDVMRDAERYRYLRARDDGTAGVGCWIEADGRVCDRGWLYGVQLDSAIDSFIEVLAAAPKPEAKP